MTIGSKSMLILLASCVAAIVLSGLVLRHTTYGSFIKLENDAVASDISRVREALQSELEVLAVVNREYSAWDDTYRFIQDRNQRYLDDYISPDALRDVDIDFLMILDDEGRHVAGFRSGSGGGAGRERLHVFDEFPSIRHRLSVAGDPGRELAGIVRTQGPPLQIVSLPILRNDRSGPALGSVVFGRYLTAARCQRLQERIAVDFELVPPTSHGIPPQLAGELGELDSIPLASRMVRHDDHIDGYTAVRDIDGGLAYVLKITTPAQISKTGAETVRTTAALLALVSLVYLLIGGVSLKLLITSPITALTRQIGRMRDGGTQSRIGTPDRQDEIGLLAKQFNALTDQLLAARDAAVNASAAKSQFLANMSHEIRTPLNGILGMTELLLESEGLNDNQRRYAETVAQSGRSLLSIINDVLDLSKIESGKLELDIAPLDLCETVERSLLLMAERADSKGLELIADIAPNLSGRVRGDEYRLQQILANLVGNAIKFTEHGEIIVRLREVPDRSDAESMIVHIEVQDTGIGVAPDKQASIFSSFSQADNSTTRQYGGTGLGLPICRELVGLMGGEIGIDSTPGKGSTFWFTSRWARDADAGAAAPKFDLAGMRILLVDDNATHRAVLRKQLAHWNAVVVESPSAAQALVELEQVQDRDGPLELILLNAGVPEMREFASAMKRRQSSRLANIPLVVLCPFNGCGEVAKLQTMADAYLTNPLVRSELYDCISRIRLGSDGAEVSKPKARDADLPAAPRLPDGIEVLLVEDNPINQAVVEGMLCKLGATLTFADNGRDALDAFKNGSFDVVFMDCQMPGMDGYEASRRIRRWEAEAGRDATPIVALTANALATDRQKCLDAGMSGYVSKPFVLADLSAALESALDGRQATANEDDGQSDPPTLAAVSDRGKSDSPIDWVLLESMIAEWQDPDEPSQRGQFIDLFVSTSDDLMRELHEALDDGDRSALCMAAHSWKSSSAMVGAGRLAELCDRLENVCQNGEMQLVRKLVKDIGAEYQRVIAALAPDAAAAN